MLKKTIQLVAYLAIAISLISCGGSSNSGATTPAPTPANNLRFTITVEKDTVPTNLNEYPIRTDSPFLSQVNVQVTFENGSAIPEGTPIELRTSNVQRGPISTLDDPETTNINEFTTLFGSVFNEAAGGFGTFFIHGGQESGNIVLTASAVDPDTGRTSTGSINYSIVDGPGEFDVVSITSERTNIPVNVFGLPPEEAIGTLLVTEAEITFRDALGNLASPLGGTVGVSINPVLTAAYSTLDDPETPENEIFQLIGQGPVNIVGGKGTIFIWSGTQAGVATVSVNATDALTGEVSSNTLEINVDSTNTGLPDSVSFDGIAPLYVNGSGGRSATNVQINVTDSDLPIVDPNGFNNVNVQFSVDGQAAGEQVSGVDINGQTVTGNNINVATNDGFTLVELRSGTEQNTVRITATIDRADNNVDNGLQDPITATRSVAIGDGILHSLEITGPDLEAIFANRINDNTDDEGNLIGPFDGTYGLLVTVFGTDKAGNPALPQTVQFGLIDSPLVGFPADGPGTFAISGVEGDPDEGTTTFNATDGEFLTAANGVEPGDTVIVFAEEINGNEDLESANRVSSVNSETSLTTLERFNRNNGTGVSIDDGDIFPYAVGRAVDGSINSSATLDQNGVASTILNYPVSKLGKLAAIYVKGQGRPDNGDFESIVDAEVLVYPGIAATETRTAKLVASPILIGANQPSQVIVCATDALDSPLQGLRINWSYTGAGQGSIDGQSGSGTFDNATGSDGCAIGEVQSSGLTGGGSSENGFNFNSGTLVCTPPFGQQVCVRVAQPGESVLNANPSAFFTGGTKTIILTLTDSSGNPIPNVALSGQCTASGGVISISQGPSVTDENGQSEVIVQASIDMVGSAGSGTCDFSAAGGSPSTTVSFQGVDICELAISPNIPAGCPTP